MKWCFFMLLLAGSYIVRGQQRPGLFDAIPRWHPDSVLVLPVPLNPIDKYREDEPQRLAVLQQPSVIFLAPDRMACRVPDWRKIERMPVGRLQNAEKMPNPLKGKSSGHPLYH